MSFTFVEPWLPTGKFEVPLCPDVLQYPNTLPQSYTKVATKEHKNILNSSILRNVKLSGLYSFLLKMIKNIITKNLRSWNQPYTSLHHPPRGEITKKDAF